MPKIGMVTIGQAPRLDMAPVIEKYIEGRSELVQVGVLDGLIKETIEEHLSPDFGDYVLTTRLTNGDSVVMSREKIQPIIQDKIHQLEKMGIKQILLLCTGVFPGLQTNTSYLIEPDQIIPSAVKAIIGNLRLGVIIPLAEQVDSIINKFSQFGMSPTIQVASPYKNDLKNFEKAGKALKEKVDIILLDCMAYSEQSRELVSKITGLPVIVSNVIMAKLVSEMI
ncbi:AroM family protein [Bacillus sp. AFS041924]|uniref:AroM family protein n=1 Tax=Bacillus sp. AFS041924 TaxID=2033503 RepID=UPI000BFDF8FF|nr:AroM family protein [Bacillus sp. AFS041924]PGS51923.1 AroM protein [Bacillus sp. AFS041924]